MKDYYKILKNIKQTIRENIKLNLIENIISPPDIPGAMHFWHGGNLDNYDDIIAQKNGRYDYGPGLYITNHYDTAKKYAKGSRKLYLISVAQGINIKDSIISMEAVTAFVKLYIKESMRNTLIENFKKYDIDGNIKAYIFNNVIINNNAIKASNTKVWRDFLIENGIDYEIVDNAFGWGEKMMVLYNMKKIVNIIQVKPGDKINSYELL